MKSNKVGIASYWESMTNYGQIFQGVALQHVLKDMGFDPFTIKYSMVGETVKKSLVEKLQDLWNGDIAFSQRIFKRIKRTFSKAKRKTCFRPDQQQRQFDAFK